MDSFVVHQRIEGIVKFKSRRLMLSGAGLFVLVAIAAGQPALASTAEPTPAPAPNVSQEFLQQNDVTGNVASVQTDAKGAQFYFYDSGDWVLQLPSDAAQGDVTAQYEAGICVGTFVNITRLSNQLYWGGQESCASAPADAIYPHSLHMVLRSTCDGFPCGIMSEQRQFTSQDSAYNAVQTVNGFEDCITNTTYDYDQIAYPTVRGTQYGPFVDGPLAAVACNINPD